MPRFWIWLVVLCALLSRDAFGMFMYYETRTVPLTRLLANLEARLAKDTNDFETTYHLARVHSMAYATNLEEITVRKNDEAIPVFTFPGSDAGVPETVSQPGSADLRRAAMQHLTNAIILYERAILLLKQSTNIAQHQWLIVPTQLGLAWCLDQSGQKEKAISAYHKALRTSWKMEVTGDFNVKDWLQDVWNDVRSGRNPIHERRRGYLGPGVCYSQEIIGYLLKLLDQAKDASEIAKLKNDEQTLKTMPRAITPILIGLSPDSTFDELVNTNARVAFDLDGSGLAREWGWITPKAAWLVYDPKRNGRITSGLQMFGNVTFWIFWRDGYEALRGLDDNGDGVLSGEELQGLALWRDSNENGVSEPGEVLPVENFGITNLSCNSQEHPTGVLWNVDGVVFKDGSKRASYDWVVPSIGERTETR